jgi:Tol biopolymer transport system component
VSPRTVRAIRRVVLAGTGVSVSSCRRRPPRARVRNRRFQPVSIAFVDAQHGVLELGTHLANPEQKAHSVRSVGSYIPWDMAGRRRLFAILVGLVAAGIASGTAVSATTKLTPATSTGELPVWSPDGKQIAFVVPSRFGFQVEVMSPSGAGRRVVASFTRTGLAAELRWMGPRRLVVSIDPNGELRSINVSTGEWLDLGGLPGGTGCGCGSLSLGADDNFAVAPDGRRVAFTADSPYQNQNVNAQGFLSDPLAIGVLTAAGRSSRLLAQPIDASDAYPSFSPDGTQLVFTRILLTGGSASAPSLMTQFVNGSPAQSMHIQGQRPVWSPNGRWIAYQALPYGLQGLMPSQLEIASPSGSGRHSLWSPPQHVGLVLSWSPDSTRIAFITESGQMGVTTIAGRVTIFKLPASLFISESSVGGVPDNPPQWSPNGKSLVFTAAPASDHRDTHVYAIGADGRGLRALGGTR